jgi:phosphonopyruvate decarboxylase
MVRPDLRVVVVDGDGAALMRMGNFATLGSYARDNLHHILLDNEAHESTGAQATVAANVDFADVARACGYGLAVRGDTLRALDELFATPATANGGPRFLHMKIATGTLDELPRPAVTPPAVLARLRRHLGSVST